MYSNKSAHCSPQHQASCVSTRVEVKVKRTQDISVCHPTSYNIVIGMEKNMLKHKTPREVCDKSKHECKKFLLIMNWGVMLGGGQSKSLFLVWQHFKETNWNIDCWGYPLILFQIKLNAQIHCGRDGTWPTWEALQRKSMWPRKSSTSKTGKSVSFPRPRSW